MERKARLPAGPRRSEGQSLPVPTNRLVSEYLSWWGSIVMVVLSFRGSGGLYVHDGQFQVVYGSGGLRRRRNGLCRFCSAFGCRGSGT